LDLSTQTTYINPIITIFIWIYLHKQHI